MTASIASSGSSKGGAMSSRGGAMSRRGVAISRVGRTLLPLHPLTLLLLASLLLTQTFLLPGPGSVLGGPLDNQLPDTTGLFFGKRASHPNMNNLLFGRRALAAGLEEEEEEGAGAGQVARLETRYLCRAVKQQCERLRVWQDQ